MQQDQSQQQRNILYGILKYGGLLAVSILATGSILSAVNGLPTAFSCASFLDLVSGIIRLNAICWFILGLLILMSIPMVALITILIFSIRGKDLRLIIITLTILVLLIEAFLYSG